MKNLNYNFDNFNDAEKEVINLLYDFGLDRTKMLKEFAERFECANKFQAESQYLRIQRTILDKICHTGAITYPEFVDIARKIRISNP